MISVARYDKLLAELEQAKREADRAEGSAAQLAKAAKEKFDCDSFDELVAWIERQKKKIAKQEKKLESLASLIEEALRGLAKDEEEG
jgi:predicted Mrr-cat superfamily restriction endonuclease